jgi:hypothetical protein
LQLPQGVFDTVRSDVGNVIAGQGCDMKASPLECGKVGGVAGRRGDIDVRFLPASGIGYLHVSHEQIAVPQPRAGQVKKNIRIRLVQDQVADKLQETTVSHGLASLKKQYVYMDRYNMPHIDTLENA